MIDEFFVDAYEELRISVFFPLTINSGYRCPRHNEKVGGFIPSRHKAGMAIDIAYNFKGHMTSDEFLALAKKSGFEFVKYYKTKKFFHLNV